MLKKDIRLNYQKLRTALSSEEVSSFSKALIEFLRELPIWEFTYFHLFLPIDDKKEADTYQLVHLLWESGKKVVIPKIKDQLELEHYLLETDTELQLNQWGIPEPSMGTTVSPEQIEVVFVPLLAFDRLGHRVGYGKGYYDRFLENCRPGVVKVGLSFFGPVDAISDLREQDIALDYCITPTKIYSF